MRNFETISDSGQPVETPVGGGFRLEDILYVLFRHKWKILFFCLLGFAAAGAIIYKKRPLYTSEAKLLIRYVLDKKGVTLDPDDAQIRSTDVRGDSIIPAEMEILTSLDLAKEVAVAIGPTNFLGYVPEYDPVLVAAGTIGSGLLVDTPRGGNIVRVRYKHRDPRTALLVLNEIVTNYFKLHARAHGEPYQLRDLASQADQKRMELVQAEARLSQLKRDLGIFNVEASKETLSEQLAGLQTKIYEVEAELAEARSAIGAEAPRQDESASSPAPVVETVPPDSRSQYVQLVTSLDALHKQRQEYLQRFTAQSFFVTSISEQIKKLQAERFQLERDFPSLTNTVVRVDREQRTGNEVDIAGRIRALTAKLTTLQTQHNTVRQAAMKLDEREADIVQAERERKLYQEQYDHLSRSLDQARVASALDPERLANISIIESPTPPAPDYLKLLKLVGAAMAGCIGAGFGLAFFLEFFADQSIHRPIHVERHLRAPLYLTIPRVRSGTLSDLNGDEGSADRPEGTALMKRDGDRPNGKAVEDDLRHYSEALRDRLLMHFQITGAVHKPKLVGVTSCGHGAGVTTTALGLAAALSETGDGSVLYVNVDPRQGPSAHQFRAGKSMIGIADALEAERREAAMVQENLYVATLNDPNSQRVGVLPKQLSRILPRLKASDYDYIIFDLPPITQTSATGRLAGLLDMTLVTLDSGKTNRELARRATELLSESRAQVGIILNKHRRYLPAKFKTDL